MPGIHAVLKKYWGYQVFRPLQEEIMQAVLKDQDVLAIMPTGGGKSLCYQVPALARDGLCLVISPLIALMRDQVQRLQSLGIPALAIFSGMRYSDVRQTFQNAAFGNYKFLYVSPERLETDLFQEWLPSLKLSLVAVDEAHCISQWGYDFRPAYLTIARIRESKPSVPLLALTASATPSVQDDICEKLLLKKPARFVQPFERPNLSYSVFNPGQKLNKLVEILQKVPGSSIVYCKSRKKTLEIADDLVSRGIKASHYHAGLTPEERAEKQEKWQKNELPVMVCTNAFGMGIDKPDVRTVVHMDVPDCLESYYQEAGRAGRDGKKSYAVLLYASAELNDLNKQSSVRFPEISAIRRVYQSLVNYLQLPSGSGEDQFFDFDLKEFCTRFKLEKQQTTYCLKALEQEDLISYAEQIFIPPTLHFIANRDEVLNWANEQPQSGQLVKILLRSYGGILDQPTPISEKQLAGGLQWPVQKLREELLSLQRSGMVQYVPQKEKPQIRFLQARPLANNVVINTGNYRKRKKAFELRVQTMVGYAESKQGCRQNTIAHYFTGVKLADCGVCDNCISARKTALSNTEFNQIVEQIYKLIEAQPTDINQLLPLLPGFKKEKAWEVIDFLVGEEKILVGIDGTIRSKKKKGPG